IFQNEFWIPDQNIHVGMERPIIMRGFWHPYYQGCAWDWYANGAGYPHQDHVYNEKDISPKLHDRQLAPYWNPGSSTPGLPPFELPKLARNEHSSVSLLHRYLVPPYQKLLRRTDETGEVGLSGDARAET